MTIIYYPQQKKRVYLSSRKRRFYTKKHLKFHFNALKNYPAFGFIKTSCFLIFPFILVFFGWLLLFSKNISLNYHLYQLKQDINRLEKDLNIIKEKSLNNYTSLKLNDWLEKNGFVEVKNLSYLDLTDENIALKPSL